MNAQMQVIWENQLSILYKWGTYSKALVKTYVPYFISAEAYERITGETYEVKE